MAEENEVLKAPRIIQEQLPKFLSETNVPFSKSEPQSVLLAPDKGLQEKTALEILLKLAVGAVPAGKAAVAASKIPGAIPAAITAATGDPTNLIPGKLGTVSGGVEDAEAARTRLGLPVGNYMRPLQNEVDALYREMSGESFLDLFGSNFPFGVPRLHFAETPEMALGQGTNKGLRIGIKPDETIRGKTNVSKPALEESYKQGAGEFIVEAQPTDVVRLIQELQVTPEAYTGLSRGMSNRLTNLLNHLEAAGTKVTREGIQK